MSKLARAIGSKSFDCPHCYAYSQQSWSSHINCQDGAGRHLYHLDSFYIAKCTACNNFSIWSAVNSTMVYPTLAGEILPNEDMPDDIKNDFEEARQIINISPRGAAALLRLAIQKLCIHLGEKGKDLNTDIGNLVKKGLPSTIQMAFDNVRVTGNNAVHPGELNIDDNPDIARALFTFVNVICDVLITQPKKIAEYYDKLPENSLRGIEKRDNKNNP